MQDRERLMKDVNRKISLRESTQSVEVSQVKIERAAVSQS